MSHPPANLGGEGSLPAILWKVLKVERKRDYCSSPNQFR